MLKLSSNKYFILSAMWKQMINYNLDEKTWLIMLQISNRNYRNYLNVGKRNELKLV